ncbi:1-deoxy-D-xylulose-5-phosphate reductoisomerase [Alphaproteobacteria bacterium LSUCC0719]
MQRCHPQGSVRVSGVVKKISIFGSTGSIGTSTLALVESCPDKFDVHVLVAGSGAELLAEQALRHRPAYVGLASDENIEILRTALKGSGIEIVVGEAACTALAREKVDVVVAGIVGLAGLPSVMAALESGQTVALANKESLVSAGALVTGTAARHGARLLPVDSEHSAIFQCWLGWAGHAVSTHGAPTDGAGPADMDIIRHICLTASGGPFREWPLDRFSEITPAQAVRHPNWSMGRKISVDSATMMNKGLEVIEAAWLFGIDSERIDVLIHPQVAIHGMIYFNDGSVVGQLGTADMKTPISYALGWPDRLNWYPEPLDLAAMGRLDFSAVDDRRYPCFRLARQALRAGGVMPTVLNAANEIAVEAFLDGQIGFTDIAAIVDRVLEQAPTGDLESLAAVLDIDARARDLARTCVERNS